MPSGPRPGTTDLLSFPAQHGAGARPRGGDAPRVGLVGVLHPGPRRGLVAPVPHVARHESLPAQRVVHVHVPAVVEQAGHRIPGRLVEQQVVALGDHELCLGQHRDRAGDRLLDLAAERGRIDRLVPRRRAQPLEQRHIAGGVEGVGRALARRTAQPRELDVGEVEAVHRHHLRDRAVAVEQGREALLADRERPLEGHLLQPVLGLFRAALAAGAVASLGATPAAAAQETQVVPEKPALQLNTAARKQVEQLLAEGRPLTGLDLENADLSAMDLSRQTMSRTNLRGANLRGAKLEDADLSEVQATNAVFTDVQAARIKLDDADLTAANFDGADLSEASLDRTNLAGVHAEKAIFRRACGEGPQFERAYLALAVFEEADLRKADFSLAMLDDVSFVRAIMPGVRLYDATGIRVIFDEATISDARADGVKIERGTFMHAEASGSVWDNSKLDEANFSKAELERASFEHAELNRAVFANTQLAQGSLRKTKLVGAMLESTNLMQATLESADLTDASLRGANLYGAETWRAKLERTDLSRAFVQRSKLGGDQK